MLLLPGYMTLQEQGFDSLAILARLQARVPDTLCKIGGGVEIGMSLEATNYATKGLLIGPISPVYLIALAAFLEGIGALDSGCLYASLGNIPCDLSWDVARLEARR